MITKDISNLRKIIDDILLYLSKQLSKREKGNLLSVAVGGSYLSGDLSYNQDVDLLILLKSFDQETEFEIKKFYSSIKNTHKGIYPFIPPSINELLKEVISCYSTSESEVNVHVTVGDAILKPSKKKFTIHLHINAPFSINAFQFIANQDKALYFNMQKTYKVIYGLQLHKILCIPLSNPDIISRYKIHLVRMNDYLNDKLMDTHPDIFLNKIIKETGKCFLDIVLFKGLITNKPLFALNVMQHYLKEREMTFVKQLLNHKTNTNMQLSCNEIADEALSVMTRMLNVAEDLSSRTDISKFKQWKLKN